MAGEKGMKWKNRKKDKAEALTWKDTTALTDTVGKEVQKRAKEESTSRSAVIRKCVEKEFNKK